MGLREIRPVLESMTDMIERGVEVGLFIEEQPGAPQRAKEVRTVLELLELA